MRSDRERALAGSAPGHGLRGDVVVAAIASLLLCRAFGGSGSDGTVVASVVWLVAAGSRWAREPRLRPGSQFVALSVAAAFCAAVTVRFGQTAQVDAVALDAAASMAGLANLRFFWGGGSSLDPWRMPSLFEPFVIVAGIAQSVAAIAITRRALRSFPRSRRRSAAASDTAVAAVVVAIAATVVWALEVYGNAGPGSRVSALQVAAFSWGAAASAWRERRGGRTGGWAIAATPVGVVAAAALAVAALLEQRLIEDTIVAGRLASTGALVVAAILVALGAIAAWDSVRPGRRVGRTVWPQLISVVASAGPIPWLLAAPVAAAGRGLLRTWSWAAIAGASTVSAVVIGVVVAAAVGGVARTGIGVVAVGELTAIAVGSLVISGAPTGLNSIDPSRPATLGPNSPQVVVIADDTVLSTIRTLGITPSAAAPPTRCGLLRDGRRALGESGVVDDLGRCSSWDEVVDDLGVGAGDIVVTGVGAWDLFDWVPEGEPATSVADPTSVERLGSVLDDIVTTVGDRGATLAVLEPLAPPRPAERVGGAWRAATWSPARVTAWREVLTAAAGRHGDGRLRVLAAPDDDVASLRARRPDGLHLVGAVSDATRAEIVSALR